jgi:hypothetical protein
VNATCSVHLILFDLITQIIYGKEYKLWSSLLYKGPWSPVPSSWIRRFYSGPRYQTPSIYVPPLTWWTKFHTHIK